MAPNKPASTGQENLLSRNVHCNLRGEERHVGRQKGDGGTGTGDCWTNFLRSLLQIGERGLRTGDLWKGRRHSELTSNPKVVVLSFTSPVRNPRSPICNKD